MSPLLRDVSGRLFAPFPDGLLPVVDSGRLLYSLCDKHLPLLNAVDIFWKVVCLSSNFNLYFDKNKCLIFM